MTRARDAIKSMNTLPVPGELGLQLFNPSASLQDLKLVIGGHSHIYALAAALVHCLPSKILANTHGIGVLAGAPTPQYLEALYEFARAGVQIGLVWQGNQHNADFMFSPGGGFDFVRSKDQDASVIEGAYLVPEALVREHFRPSLEPLAGLLTTLRKISDRRAVVIGTPPPRAEGDELRKRLASEIYFPEKAKALGTSIDAIPITPLSVRVKLWEVVQDLLQELARANDAVFIPVPAAALDVRRSLVPEYWDGDLTHANIAYGELMLSEIVFCHLKSVS